MVPNFLTVMSDVLQTCSSGGWIILTHRPTGVWWKDCWQLEWLMQSESFTTDMVCCLSGMLIMHNLYSYFNPMTISSCPSKLSIMDWYREEVYVCRLSTALTKINLQLYIPPTISHPLYTWHCYSICMESITRSMQLCHQSSSSHNNNWVVSASCSTAGTVLHQ